MNKDTTKVILKATKNPIMEVALQNAFRSIKIIEDHKTGIKKPNKIPQCMGAINNES
jgi:hypothetical protein